MSTSAVQELHEVAMFRLQNKMVWFSVERNCAGVTHEESLVHPETGGNTMNWVVGHLVCVYNNVLPLLGQAPVMLTEKIKRYDRGSKPLPKEEALDFSELLSALHESVDRWDAGLATATHGTLDRNALFSPFKDPNETVRSLIGFLMYHQSYHSGQTGVLRRVIGKTGAI